MAGNGKENRNSTFWLGFRIQALRSPAVRAIGSSVVVNMRIRACSVRVLCCMAAQVCLEVALDGRMTTQQRLPTLLSTRAFRLMDIPELVWQKFKCERWLAVTSCKVCVPHAAMAEAFQLSRQRLLLQRVTYSQQPASESQSVKHPLLLLNARAGSTRNRYDFGIGIVSYAS